MTSVPSRTPRQTKRAPSRGRPTRADATTATAEELSLRAKIEDHVQRQIKEAIDARAASGIEDIWREDADQYDGLDELTARPLKTSEQVIRTKTAANRSRIYLNITKPKTNSAASRIQEMLVPTDERPWDIEPTPIPELDKAIETPRPEAVVQLADGTPVPAGLVAVMANAQAGEKSLAMKTWIEDQFVEGSVYAEMRKVIQDACRKGSGCLKGPFPVMREKRTWRRDETGVYVLEVTQERKPTSKRIPIEGCFPSPDCGDDIHKGSYFVEREHMTARDLHKLAQLPEYDAAIIASILEEGPMRGSQLRSSYETRTPSGRTTLDARMFEVFYFYGWICPDDLVQMGLYRGREGDAYELTPEEVSRPYLPAVVTMANGRAIKVVLNPMASGDFPYDIFPCEQMDDQPWGRGYPRMMRTPQMMLVSASRRLMENGGLSAGPQVVTAGAGCIVPADGKNEITSPKLWRFTPTENVQTIQQAFAVFEIKSAQGELAAIIQFALDMADRLTNIPLMMQGEQQAGTSPETLGGMKMLLSNSSSTLRTVAKLYDDKLIVPHLRRYNDWGMEHGPDEAKGDHQIVAKGSTELVQREEDAEFIVILWSMKDNPDLRINVEKLAQAMARTKHFNLATVQYTEDEWKARQDELAKAPPAPPDPQVQIAQIRLQAEQAREQGRQQDAEAERQFKAQEGQAERDAKAALAEVDKQIEIMRLSGSENIEISKIKAALATKAADHRVAADEMAMKMNPANPSHMGI